MTITLTDRSLTDCDFEDNLHAFHQCYYKIYYILTLSQTNPGVFKCLQYKSIENTVEKGEIVRY